MASRIDRTPACIEMRVPHTTRENVSRPRSSVPKGWAQLGALRIWLQSVRTGSEIAIHGAARAMPANASTISAPASAGGRRRTRRQPRRSRSFGSASTRGAHDADPRIENRVGDVDQQVDEHVGGGGDQHYAL